MMKVSKIILTLLFTFSAFAQAPLIQWQKVYGGNVADGLNTIKQTSDGGYLLLGDSESGISGDKVSATKGGRDNWIIKTSSTGAIEWQKDIGGSGDDSIFPVVQTSDGGYLVGGNSDSSISGDKTENSHGFADFWILRLDPSGNIVWQNTIGGGYLDLLFSIIQTPDGGFLLGGSSISNQSEDKTEDNVGFTFGTPYTTYFDYWIIKIDALGNIEWDNTIGSKSTDSAYTVLNATDGGYLVGGFSNCDVSGDYNGPSQGGLDCWILKLDLLGNILWQKTIGGSANDQLRAIITTSDGGYLLGAISNSNISGNKTENNKGLNDFWIVKLDANGNITWDKTIGGLQNDILYSMKESNNGDFYLGGTSSSNISGDKSQNSRGGEDFWLVKMDSLGNVLWDKTIGGSQDETDCTMEYNSIDDSIIIGGPSLSSISGDKMELSRGLSDYWVVNLDSDSLGTTTFDDSKILVYPNPTTGEVNVDFPNFYKNLKISVLNTLGQLVFAHDYFNRSKIQFNLEGLKGIYFVTVETDSSEKKVFKFVKE